MFKRIDDNVWVSGQITPEDVAAAATAGVRTIVNNRPDAEVPGQPASSEIEATANALGLGYHHIPVAGLNAGQVEAMTKVLAESGGPVLAFCRSGTRSAYLWALARSSQGADGDELIRAAAAAGYDLAPIARLL